MNDIWGKATVVAVERAEEAGGEGGEGGVGGEGGGGGGEGAVHVIVIYRGTSRKEKIMLGAGRLRPIEVR